MREGACSNQMAAQCGTQARRALVAASGHLAGLDYVEVYPDRVTLCVRFFGRPPAGLTGANVVIEGGERITGIQVLDADFEGHEDGDVCLRVTVDRCGDFSRYCLCLVDPDARGKVAAPAGIDPRYACAGFFFRIDCPLELDCAESGCTAPPAAPAIAIDYLARDYNSFRRLLLDRMSTMMPDWQERHVPDLGVAVAEVLAYLADQFSYTLDAVATEAYLLTARRRISVRRHARLLDYRLHEGCNARAWLCIDTSADVVLELDQLVFAAPPPRQPVVAAGLQAWQTLRQAEGATVFEPIDRDGSGKLVLLAAHNAIPLYTWRQLDCVLPLGATSTTLLDASVPQDGAAPQRQLRLAPGAVVILEEIRGARTGAAADADPARRHAVRLTAVTPFSDPLDGALLLDIAWAHADALPWPLRLSARTAAPDCRWVDCAVARANTVLVDHGASVDEASDDWVVETDSVQGCCSCDGLAADMQEVAAPFNPVLGQPGLSWCERGFDAAAGATAMLVQDPRQALPALQLDFQFDPGDATRAALAAEHPIGWLAAPDLLSGSRDQQLFVAEVDDEGYASLRFGSGDDGRMPPAGARMRARYRIGNGSAGNVGHDSIVWMALRTGALSGVDLRPRNPLAARGGIDAEPVADAKHFAPRAYGRALERAVAAADYGEFAAQDSRLQGAYAELVWSGSWYEVALALDPFANASDDATLPVHTMARLEQVRRIGHDLACVPAKRVPLAIALDVCVAPGYRRADVKRALQDAMSTRALADGQLGVFHPDRLRFGQAVRASSLVALAQQTDGVAHASLLRFARAGAAPDVASRSLADGLLPMAADEIAQVDGNPDFPERGSLTITVRGGR